MEIPEIKLIPAPETEEARNAVGYKYNSEAGTRHKLGGKPDFLQAEDWPSCCGKEMTFYGQLDSIGDDYDLADCGMIYVFVCFDCFNKKYFACLLTLKHITSHSTRPKTAMRF